MPDTWYSKGAPKAGALFAFGLLWLALLLPLAAGAACPADHIDRRAAVGYVFDGDTVALADRTRVRLIGVNTPEIAHDGHRAEPYGQAAEKALRRLLKQHGNRVGLRYDAEPRDRYGRRLAHLYLDDGTSVETWLLKQGLATTLTIPPNVWNIDCYRQAEEAARSARRGIWALPRYQPLDSRHIAPATTGFHLVRGKVVRVGHSRKSVWLNLEGGVALRIDRRELHYFGALDIDHLRGKTVLARGWLRPSRKELRMRVRHPAALQLLP